MAEPERRVTIDEIQGAPRRTGRFWFDFVAASAAIFISVVSLLIGMRSEATQRELLAANAWPFLELDEERKSLESDSISVRNEGVGPAKVISFEVFYQGQPMGDAVELLRRCCGLSADGKEAHKQIGRGIGLGDVANNVIRADQSRTLINLRRPPDRTEVFDRFSGQAINALTFRACYCSILDRCWVSDLRTLKPAEVAVCPVPARPFAMIDSSTP